MSQDCSTDNIVARQKMDVLVIGGGGREHALAWKLRSSPSVRKVHAAPGNPGIATVGQCHIEQDYVALAKELRVDLTVVGPEAPLVAGVVDRFRAEGMPIVGPTAENAAIEGSKIHSKRLMERLGIPTAQFQTVATREEAKRALASFALPVVIKTDGLAAGKGVVIARSHEEAENAIASLPAPFVIEEFLEGEEVSFIVLCDGRRAVPLEPSQDHKRALDNDQGPNTGGMGAYSDSRILNNRQRGQIMDTIIEPVVRATAYTGFLYAGLMMTSNGPSVLEFNARMGDPETQPLMMRLRSDWGEALMAAARGALTPDALVWSPESATCIVLASGGYPGAFETGKEITGLDSVRDAVAFHAGTRKEGDRIVTAGGRVLGITALGENLRQSIARAYAAVRGMHFEGMRYRKDIGAKGLKRYNEAGVGT
jgi:phosphoribosylamine--glycine ligase